MRKEALQKLKEKAAKWDRAKELAERNWLDEYGKKTSERMLERFLKDANLTVRGNIYQWNPNLL